MRELIWKDDYNMYNEKNLKVSPSQPERNLIFVKRSEQGYKQLFMEEWREPVAWSDSYDADQWRNNSRKNEGMEPKQKQYPAVDVTGNRSKVPCCKEQYCIGTWNVRSMSQGKLEEVKQEMARENVNILGISKLKWSGMGEFNSDDHYIYYCGQESLRRNGVAIMVNKRVQNAVKWSEGTQSCLTLCIPMDCSQPGSSVHGIFQGQEYWSGLPIPSPGLKCHTSYV